MARTVRVRGLRELQRDFKRMSKQLDSEVTDALKRAAEPVKQTAQMYALGRIRNAPESPRWTAMKIGVSRARGSVYIRPAARRRGGSPRPKFGPLLLTRAMEPAVDAKQNEVVDEVDKMLGDLAGDNGF